MIYLTYATQIMQIVLLISLLVMLFLSPEQKNLNLFEYKIARKKHFRALTFLCIGLTIASIGHICIEILGL